MIVTDDFIKHVSADAFTIFQGMNCPESVLSYNREDEAEVNDRWEDVEKVVSNNTVLDTIAEYAVALEQQYFMYGFEYAIKMMEGGRAV